MNEYIWNSASCPGSPIVGEGGPLPNIIRTGACELESNHIHVAASDCEFAIGTGTFHQSAFSCDIQFSGEVPAHAAFGAWLPNQFVGNDQPMSTLLQVLP